MSLPRPDVIAAAVTTHLAVVGLASELGRRPNNGGWTGAQPGTGTFRPYLIQWPDPGTPEGTLATTYDGLLYGFQITAVGETAAQALQWQGRARDRLLPPSEVPTLIGAVFSPLWQDGGPQPVIRDDDETPNLYAATAQYRARIVPA